MAKVDYKKQFERTCPKSGRYGGAARLLLDGQGDPNGETFAEVVTALYSFSYCGKNVL